MQKLCQVIAEATEYEAKDRECALIPLNVEEIRLSGIKSMVTHEEAYLRILVDGNEDQNGIYYFNRTKNILRKINNVNMAAFDEQFCDKMQESMQARALNSDQVQSISKLTRQYLHATSDLEELQFARASKQKNVMLSRGQHFLFRKPCCHEGPSAANQGHYQKEIVRAS